MSNPSSTYFANKLDEVDEVTQLPTPDSLTTWVRFLVGDTGTGGEWFLQDAEIRALVRRWYPLKGTVEYVASMAADTIASRYAQEASYSADGVSVGLGAVASQFRDLSAQLRMAHVTRIATEGIPEAGGMDIGEQRDGRTKPLDFGTGMHDNPEAGQQAYGDSNDQYDYEFWQ